MNNRLLFCLLAGFLASPVVASNLPCHDCTFAAARNRAIGAGAGEHYVFDYPRGMLRRFSVTCGALLAAAPGSAKSTWSAKDLMEMPAAASACGPSQSLSADPIENEPSVVQGFLDLKWFWDQTGGTMAKVTELNWSDIPNAGPNASAYQVVSDFNFRSRAGDAIAMHVLQQWRLNFIFSAVNAWAGFSDGVRISIVVKFPDGTTSLFNLTYPEPSAEYDRNSSRTPNGQGIPEANSSSYAGQWSTDMGGSPTSLTDFVRHLDRLGIPVASGSGTIVSCTWDGPNRTLTCRIVH